MGSADRSTRKDSHDKDTQKKEKDALDARSTFAVMRRRGPRLAGLPGFLRLLLVGGMSGEIGLR